MAESLDENAGPESSGREGSVRAVSLKDILLGGGLLVAIFGTGGELVKEWAKDDQAAICAPAHEAMRDDRLNAEVPAALREEYLENQARLAISCAKAGLN